MIFYNACKTHDKISPFEECLYIEKGKWFHSLYLISLCKGSRTQNDMGTAALERREVEVLQRTEYLKKGDWTKITIS